MSSTISQYNQNFDLRLRKQKSASPPPPLFFFNKGKRHYMQSHPGKALQNTHIQYFIERCEENYPTNSILLFVKSVDQKKTETSKI